MGQEDGRERNIWEERIADLRRYDLDNLDSEPLNPADIRSWPVPNLTFVRVDGILRSWDIEREKQQQSQQQQPDQDPSKPPKRMYLMEDALTGLHGQRANLAYLVLGNKQGVQYYMGASLPNTAENGAGNEADSSQISFQSLKSILHSVYNGVDIYKEAFSAEKMKSMVAPLANHIGVITGIPALKSTGGDTMESEQIERLAGGLQGHEFGMLVLAVPIPNQYVNREEFSVVDAIQKAQENEDPEKKRRIKYYLELQDAYLKHIQLGTAIGSWQVGTYFFAADRSVFVRLQSLLRATYTDETSRPTPLRSHELKGLKPHLENFGLINTQRASEETHQTLLSYKLLTPLNSRMLSAFIHLPKREMPGFRIRRSAEFSLAEIPPKDPTRVIAIGNILDRGVDTGNLYYIDVDAMQKHTIVCGVTGGGKTNTCFYLLGQLWKFNIPFMVCEPAKSEYRHMMLMSETFKGVGQAFSLGDETVSPFRLNPFEIMKGVKVQTHLDALKSVFNASFEMYSPMPQVLEKALNSIYNVRGWDLVQNKNRRLPPGVEIGDPDCPPEIYPTMKDLYEIIEPITESFGYSERIGPDVQAALKARIGSLLIGGKGQMLNTRRSIPMQQLFGRPTVVELKMVSEDSEKSFLMGMLLVFLYEFREALGPHDTLQHVMLVEEAHRLLKNVPTAQSGESANPAGKAVEFFTNMLAEIRSYGQGFIIADQIPNKLAPEALKNTNLKIMHRIVAVDDRDSMGGAMNLDDIQKRHVTALGQGRAIVYAEKMEQPYHLAIMFDKTKEVPPPETPEESDQVVRDAMAHLQIVQSFDRHLGCKFCLHRCDSQILDTAIMVADDPLFRQVYNRYILSTLKDLTQLVHFRAQIIHEIQRVIGGRARSGNITGITWCVLTQATERYFERKGEENYWYYDQVKEQHLRWLNLLRPAFQPTEVNRRLDISVLKQWRDDFIELHKRDQGPLPTCGPCTSKCVYRFEVSEVVRDPKIKFDFNSSINRKDTPASDSAAWFCRLLTERLIGQGDVDLSYCLAVHLIKDQQLSTDAQLVLLHKVRTALENFQNEGEAEQGSGG
ncbi:MAG: ATP-binding protein [Candidatus Melainabacteria bacterium]|nr:MAG: ATP-binding protein [Candidatus Melainabacteria bacterium]